MSNMKILSAHVHIDSKETDAMSKKSKDKKDNDNPNINEVKKPPSQHQSQTDPKGSTSRTDNLDSIIINLSQLEGNGFEKKADGKSDPNE